jgi:hypothetical protein
MTEGAPSPENLRAVYAEKSSELRSETESANKLTIAFAGLQVGLAAWMFSNDIVECSLTVSIFLADLVVAACAWKAIQRNYGRRQEILSTLNKAVDGLDLRAIQDEPYRHSWKGIHGAVIIALTLMQLLPLAQSNC